MIQRNQTTLNVLPYEMRIQIFKLVLAEEWNGAVPTLIKALRCEMEMYAEAIEVFNLKKRFRLHQSNDWSFSDMPHKMLLTIGRINIVLQ
jgi:hypothetical protein